MREEYRKYYHPKFKIVAKLIRLLYQLDGCNCGGCCHVVVDDNNIRNSDLETVIKYCNENKDKIDSELSELICKLLLQMTIEQRIILFYSLELNSSIFEEFDESEYSLYFDIAYDPKYIIQICKERNMFNVEE